MMTTELQTFEFQSHQLTVITDEHGEPWFIAKEVAEILGYSAAEAMTRRLDDDEKLVRQIVVSGQNRDALLINESGLYSSIIGSNKPDAKAFKKWLTSEVLPAIRKTGSYGVAQQAQSTAYLEEVKSHLDTQKQLVTSLQDQVSFLKTEIAKLLNGERGMYLLYEEADEKNKRLLRSRGKVKYLEERDIMDKHYQGWDIKQIADWAFRSKAMIRKVLLKNGVSA